MTAFRDGRFGTVMKLLLLTASSLLAGRGHALHAGLAEHDAYPHRETDFAATHASSSSSLLGGASGMTYSCQQGQNCDTNPVDTTDCNGCPNSGTCPSDHGFGFMTGNICGLDGNQPPCYAVALEAGVNMYCPSGWAATQFCSSGSQQNCPNPSGTSGTLYEGVTITAMSSRGSTAPSMWETASKTHTSRPRARRTPSREAPCT